LFVTTPSIYHIPSYPPPVTATMCAIIISLFSPLSVGVCVLYCIVLLVGWLRVDTTHDTTHIQRQMIDDDDDDDATDNNDTDTETRASYTRTHDETSSSSSSSSSSSHHHHSPPPPPPSSIHPYQHHQRQRQSGWLVGWLVGWLGGATDGRGDFSLILASLNRCRFVSW
jgi:hypothetical protein